ncbi:hypothetical protein EXIGLDRAFT_654276 [Exidia glandulosa HHB12029]|uniref:GST N-terminal domain-containing protein n=1 Tax=Exidia glandulosa HHB12029 TaxID=1314781 RepID=A0A165DRP1_EXIGL|nr:hypothetical protein EXIGLDRAFT_654276 [Exidia glandulosa HHB12029]
MSANTWKVRLALNYKRIPYRTHWLTYLETEPVVKSLGAKPTGKKPAPDNNEDWYTLPVISSLGKVVEDSEVIAEYLDAAYPDTPRLFPVGFMRGLQAAFAQLFAKEVTARTVPLLLPGVPANVDAANGAYFAESRKRWYGAPLDEWAPLGSEKRARKWEAAKEGWGTVAQVYEASGGPWLMGKEPVYADFIVVAWLACARTVILEQEFELMLQWHGGLWSRLWDASSSYRAEP